MKRYVFLYFICHSLIGYNQSTFQVEFEKPEWAITGGAKDIVETKSGDIYAVGIVAGSSRDVRLIRVDSKGAVLLDTLYDFTPSYEFNPKIISAHDGGVLVATTSFSYPIDDQDGIQDILIWKIAPNGVIEWQKVIAARSFHSMTQTEDGNYVILGSHYSKSLDLLLTKINVKGDIIWRKVTGKTWNEGGNWWEYPRGIVEIDKLLYIVSFENTSGGSGTNGGIYQINENGIVNWNVLIEKESKYDKIFLAEPFKFHGNYYCRETYNNRLYQFNEKTGEFWKVDDSLSIKVLDLANTFCNNTDEVAGVGLVDDIYSLKKYKHLDTAYLEKQIPEITSAFKKIIQSQDNGYILVGTKSGGAIEITKVDCMGNFDFWSDECKSKIQENTTILLYPNPVKDKLIIEAKFDFETITIYNTIGSKTILKNMCKCNRQIIDVNFLAAGVYVLKIEGNEESAVGKFVKY